MSGLRQFYMVLLIIVLFVTTYMSAQPVLKWDVQKLMALSPSNLEYKSILRNADKFLSEECPLVTNKEKTFSGDVHNYESLSTYFWENEKDPSARWVAKDGQKNPERLKYDGAKINIFYNRCKYLAQAYCLTSDTRYSEQYLADVKSWFVNKQTRMIPNMEYAQIIPNDNGNRGKAYGIIDAYVLTDVVESLILMRQKNVINKNVENKIKKWFKKFSNWLRKSEKGMEQRSASNNLSIAYDVMMCEFYYYIGDKKRYEQIVGQFLSDRLEKQFLPDGTQPHELKRAKPISYSIYNLELVLDFCTMQWHSGVDYYSQNRQLIDAAMDYVANAVLQVDNLNNAEKPDLPVLKKKYNALLTGFANIR